MKSDKSKTITDRRKFLLGAGVAGAAAVAMPQISRAQTATWKMQGSWPATDIFSEMAQDYCKRVNDMAGGRLKSIISPAAPLFTRSRCSMACMAARSMPRIP